MSPRTSIVLVAALAAFAGCGGDELLPVLDLRPPAPQDLAAPTPGDAAAPVVDAARPGDGGSVDAASGGDGGGPSADLSGAVDDGGVPPGDGGSPDGAPPDGALPDDGGMMSCGVIGEICVNGAGCCSGNCDQVSKKCVPPPNVCAPQGAPCLGGTDCCSLSCVGGKCATQCKPNGSMCAANADCCSLNCKGGSCQPIVQGGCVTLGNKCVANADCCSLNCQGGLCVSQGGQCNAIGDICLRNVDCCSNLCTIPPGQMAGTCTAVNGMGGGNCTLDGEPCVGCSTCCSHVCAPTITGGHICAPAAGCRVAGAVCFKNTDCCGGAKNGLPGDGSVTCNIIPGTNPPIGTCSNPNGCDPDGDVCGLMMNNTCGNARHDCCDCLPPKINCCKFDKAGVPRCYGGSTQQCPNGYDGKQPCCIQAGNVCAFSNECCDGLPCVPDGNGVLRCAAMCQKAGDVCTADSDCCIGATCVIPKGQLLGTCMNPPPPPLPPDMAMPQPDMAMKPPPDMAMPVDFAGQKVDLATPPDLSKAPDLSMPKPCSQLGQSCSTMQPCCNGLTCAPPGGVGVCMPGQLDCTCVGSIG